MKQFIHDLLNHQLWADTVHWNAFEKFPRALEDPKILYRLNHIHQGQHGFLLAIQQLEIKLPDEVQEEPASLKAYAQGTHRMIQEFMQDLTEEMLDKKVSIPRFNNPEFTITRTEAFMQMTTHSHYHRGQNATRLRELGGEPPMTDLIIWYWKGRPQPEWDLV
jgi:uncharacterized damage-inducible protein DinB